MRAKWIARATKVGNAEFSGLEIETANHRPGWAEHAGYHIPPTTLDSFLARVRAERVGRGLPEYVEDAAALDAIATILDRVTQARPPAA